MPMLPNLSVQGAYQVFKAGEILDSKSWSVNTHISQNLLLFTLFGGVGIENTKVDLNYIVKSSNIPVSRSITGGNKIRFVLGVMAKLGLLNVNSAINFGSYNAISAGVGISFR